MQGLVDAVKSFIAEPFTQKMSLWHFAALVGVTMVLVILWNFVLKEIERGVSEV